MEMTIDRKALKLGIKNGFGFSEFEERYGMDRDNLTESVFILYKKNRETAEDLLREIGRNEKKHEKERAKEPVVEYKGVPIEEFKSMSMDEFMKLENGTANDTQKDTIPEKVKLESEIHELQDTVAKYEADDKRWISKRQASLEEMAKLEDELKKLKEKLVSVKMKYGAIAERDEKIVKKMNETHTKLEESRTLLKEKRRRLDELNRLVICAYDDGTIAPMDESIEIILDDTGSDDLYLKLVTRAECQDLKAREILILARLLKIVENSTSRIEVACDTVEMEKAYNALVNNPDPTK